MEQSEIPPASEGNDVPAYFVECYAPDLTRGDLSPLVARAREAAGAMRSTGIGVRSLGWILLPEEDTVFCLFEAPSLAAVEELGRRAAIRVDRIVEAVHVPGHARGGSLLGTSETPTT